MGSHTSSFLVIAEEFDFFFPTSWSIGCLQVFGKGACFRGSHQKAEASMPIFPCPIGAWRSTRDPSSFVRVVEVEGVKVFQTDDFVEFFEGFFPSFFGADIVARDEDVAGVDADADRDFRCTASKIAAMCSNRWPTLVPCPAVVYEIRRVFPLAAKSSTPKRLSTIVSKQASTVPLVAAPGWKFR